MNPRIKEISMLIPYKDIGDYAQRIIDEKFPDTNNVVVNVSVDDDEGVIFTFEISDKSEIVEGEVMEEMND